MSNHPNFVPDYVIPEKRRPFKYWVQTVLPIVYDDSLSYMELLNKVVVYLNNTMTDVNTLTEEFTDLTNAFSALQDYILSKYDTLEAFVNDYFNNLDVQKEINNKLDGMVEDGTLDELIQPYIDVYANDLRVLEARMDTFASLPDGSTSGDAELLDIRVGADGTTYPTAGDAVRKQIAFIQNGKTTLSKSEVLGLTTISTDRLYKLDNVVVGTTTLDEITANASIGAKAIKVPLTNAKTISYPVFKTTGNYGSFIFDENDVVLWMYSEPSLDTGTQKTINVPQNASYMLLSVSSSLSNMNGWYVELSNNSLADIEQIINDVSSINNKVDLLYGKTVTKAEASQTPYNRNTMYRALQTEIGKSISAISTVILANAYTVKIDLTNVKTISYPVFKTTGNYGSFIFDENDVAIWCYAEVSADTGTMKTIIVPENASYMLLSITPTLDAMDWKYVLYAIEQIQDNLVTPFKDVNKNMCLAGIKTDILDNKIPFHRGYLFHKLQNNDNSLWYGADFKHINKIGIVSYDPTLMRFAISPKDGRIIAVQRDTRNGIWIWDGETETHLNSFESNPQAWLYNSGVDFIKNGDTEYCIFAEYSGTVVSGYTLNVWKGVYPYTDDNDWSIVFSQVQSSNITHFHMVRRDPWTNILYLTAGDSSAESKWWYSTDFGETWTLLVSGTDTGWGNSLCRTINFVFAKDYIYWATDHGEAGSQHHTLNRIQRDSQTGVMDLSTKEQLALLPQLYATNSLCYVESPNGLFMYDRIDVNSSSVFGQPIKMMFWDFASEELIEIASLTLTSETWGGSRGKCYINYTNSKEVMPAMGFSIDTPCIFDLVCDNPSNIGTIAYDVGGKTVHTINW